MYPDLQENCTVVDTILVPQLVLGKLFEGGMFIKDLFLKGPSTSCSLMQNWCLLKCQKMVTSAGLYSKSFDTGAPCAWGE